MRFAKFATVAALAVSAFSVVPQTASAAPAPQPAGPSSGCSATGSPLPQGQTTAQTITSGGRNRSYLVRVPSTYQAGQQKAVIFAFHGRGGNGYGIEAFSGLDGLDAIVVYGVGVPGEGQNSWQGAPYAAAGVDDVRYTGDILDKIESTFCVDTTRVFATGKSNGAGLVALLACRLADRIAAFATVSGAFYPGTGAGCSGSKPAPIVDFHGTADSTMPYNGGTSHDTPVPDLMAWAQSRATHNGCTTGPSNHVIASDVKRSSWTNCANRAVISHYRIDGGGHTWAGELVDSGPGSATQSIKAQDVMWAFFNDHTLV